MSPLGVIAILADALVGLVALSRHRLSQRIATVKLLPTRYDAVYDDECLQGRMQSGRSRVNWRKWRAGIRTQAQLPTFQRVFSSLLGDDDGWRIDLLRENV